MNIYKNLCLLLTLSCISLIAMENPSQAEKNLPQYLSNALYWGTVVGGDAIKQGIDNSREVVEIDTDLEKLSKKKSLDLDEQLLAATVLGDHRKIEELLIKGANPTIQTEERQETPLMHAAHKGYPLCVKALLTTKIPEQINMQNKWGFTALDIAANNNSHELIPDLVKAGADVNRCPVPRAEDKINKKGKYPYLPPLLMARWEGLDTTIEVLIRCGAKEIEEKS